MGFHFNEQGFATPIRCVVLRARVDDVLHCPIIRLFRWVVRPTIILIRVSVLVPLCPYRRFVLIGLQRALFFRCVGGGRAR